MYPKRYILYFLLPAVVLYSLFMIYPLMESFRLSFYQSNEQNLFYVGLDNYRTLLGDPQWKDQFLNALKNNFYFFLIHMIVQNPLGLLFATLLTWRGLLFSNLYRTLIFIPTLLSFVLVGFIWKLILSPLWGVAEMLLDLVGWVELFQPWLGLESTALTTVSLISVWQFVGIPMMLFYAALISIPDEIIDAAYCDGLGELEIFFKIKLPLLLPTIGIVSILTFVGNFNAFDLIYVMQGGLAGPAFSTDIMGTMFYRTFFGFQLQTGDLNLGAALASIMFMIILGGVMLYLLLVQYRLRRVAL